MLHTTLISKKSGFSLPQFHAVDTIDCSWTLCQCWKTFNKFL